MALIKNNENSICTLSTPSKSLNPPVTPLKSPRPNIHENAFSDKISDTVTTQSAIVTNSVSMSLKPDAVPFMPSGQIDQLNPIYTNNTRPSYKVEPSIGAVSQGLSSLTMADSHLTSHLGIPHPLPPFSPHYAQQSVIQTKRPSLPYFSARVSLCMEKAG